MKHLFIFFLFIFLFGCEKFGYDYRDELIGDYICNETYYTWTIDHYGDSKYSVDTLTVEKAKNDKLQIRDNVFELDENLEYFEHFGGSTYINAKFFTDNDSIYFYDSSGGNGGGSVHIYTGLKN